MQALLEPNDLIIYSTMIGVCKHRSINYEAATARQPSVWCQQWRRDRPENVYGNVIHEYSRHYMQSLVHSLIGDHVVSRRRFMSLRQSLVVNLIYISVYRYQLTSLCFRRRTEFLIAVIYASAVYTSLSNSCNTVAKYSSGGRPQQ